MQKRLLIGVYLLSVGSAWASPVGTVAARAEELKRAGTRARVADVASRHILLGWPSSASKDKPNDYLLVRNSYVMSYNREHNGLNWVSWQVGAADLGAVERTNQFRTDPTLPKGWYHPVNADYLGGGFSRGHMVRSGERTNTEAANRKTFVFTNMLPQAVNNNTGPWLALENYYLEAVKSGKKEAHVLAGGIFEGPPVPGRKVAVPSATWKVVALLEPGQSPDAIDERTRIISVIIPNNNEDVEAFENFAKYRVSVHEIEKRTGLTLLSALPAPLKEKLGARVDDEIIPRPPAPDYWKKKRDALVPVAHGVAGEVKSFDEARNFGFLRAADGAEHFFSGWDLPDGVVAKAGDRFVYELCAAPSAEKKPRAIRLVAAR